MPYGNLKSTFEGSGVCAKPWVMVFLLKEKVNEILQELRLAICSHFCFWFRFNSRLFFKTGLIRWWGWGVLHVGVVEILCSGHCSSHPCWNVGFGGKFLPIACSAMGQ